LIPFRLLVIALDPQVTGLITIVLFVLFIAVLGYTAAIRVGANRQYREAKVRIEDIRHLEYLARLRHRDLDAFAKELNILRAKKGKRGIPTATLDKIQFNLTYSIEEN
jgi:hypothetical protein